MFPGDGAGFGRPVSSGSALFSDGVVPVPMAENRLTFALDDETYDRLRAEAGDGSVDEWVRDAIRRKLADDGYYDPPGEVVDDCAI